MASAGSSMWLSFLLFTVVLSLEVIYRGKLASSELFTILGGFISSLIFLFFFIFIGNFQESCGTRTGWGAGKFSFPLVVFIYLQLSFNSLWKIMTLVKLL
ncbi:Protein KRTCAP2-like protein [Bienertia sinuspersici]